MNKRIGFTLVELLVVIAIIALLLAVLMPALRAAQNQAKAVVCRNNVKQWGLMLSMYANANGGHFMPGFSMAKGMWMSKLRSYYSNIGKIRLCPKATTLLSACNMSSTAFTAWGIYGDPGYANSWIPCFGEKGDYGSYGINAWLHDPPIPEGDCFTISTGFNGDWSYFWRTINVKNPAAIPAFGDSVWEGTNVRTSDAPPKTPGKSSMHDGMFNFCIPRHELAVNWSFLDNSARKVPLKELWNQKWSPNFATGKTIKWEDYTWIR